MNTDLHKKVLESLGFSVEFSYEQMTDDAPPKDPNPNKWLLKRNGMVVRANRMITGENDWLKTVPLESLAIKLLTAMTFGNYGTHLYESNNQYWLELDDYKTDFDPCVIIGSRYFTVTEAISDLFLKVCEYALLDGKAVGI